MKIACIQCNSSAEMAENIACLRGMVQGAAQAGAQLVALPENAFLMHAPGAVRVLYTQAEHPAVPAAAQMACAAACWLLAGSIAVKVDDSGKTVNRSLLFDPQGNIVAQYDKIHLFDVTLPDGEIYAESARFLPGAQAVVAKIVASGRWQVAGKEAAALTTGHLPLTTTLGLTICYDVRFAHLYRMLAQAGAQILAVPSAFTVPTGEAHWEVLLRARAIENGCFVIAPAQCGTHAGGRKTWGHSLIIDPWGRVLADGGTEEGMVLAEIDLAQVDMVRGRLPSLQHDREFALP